jgi:hypothetical protein
LKRALALALALSAAPLAHADDRPLHGSVSAGGTLLLTGDDGDRQRGELELDVEPYSRCGALVAWRGFTGSRRGLVTAGVMYEGGAARPRLVLDLHADVGADLDQHAPVIGGGIRTLLVVIGPIGLALDSGAYLVIDGVDHTRLAIATGAALAGVW